MELKKIVIVTSGQPSANPRMVKEALALEKAGFEVSVIFAPISAWADEFDKALFEEMPKIKWIKAGYSSITEKTKYRLIRMRRKVFDVLFKYFPSAFYAEKSFGLFTHELKVKAQVVKADLYIAHNLAALPAAAKASLKWKVPYAFDAEDFHRGEDKEGSRQWNLASLIEKKYLPGTIYLSAASPLISEAYKNEFQTLSTFTINNVFPISYVQPSSQQNQENEFFKMFWFSQTIGKKRGIEDVIKAIGLLKNKKVRLSLLGNITQANKEYFLKLMDENDVSEDQVNFLPIVKEKNLSIIASKHQVGLALEVPDDINRKVCLTNKIFLYLLAGNAIIFSRTPAQELFFQENNGVGSLFTSGSPVELANIISGYIDDPQLLKEHREKASVLAKSKFNWELESKFLITKISEVLN